MEAGAWDQGFLVFILSRGLSLSVKTETSVSLSQSVSSCVRECVATSAEFSRMQNPGRTSSRASASDLFSQQVGSCLPPQKFPALSVSLAPHGTVIWG